MFHFNKKILDKCQLQFMYFFIHNSEKKSTKYNFVLQNPCPEESSGFLSRLLFSWFNPLAWKGFRKPLETSDLWNMKHEDMAGEVVPLFDKYWQKSLKKAER